MKRGVKPNQDDETRKRNVTQCDQLKLRLRSFLKPPSEKPLITKSNLKFLKCEGPALTVGHIFVPQDGVASLLRLGLILSSVPAGTNCVLGIPNLIFRKVKKKMCPTRACLHTPRGWSCFLLVAAFAWRLQKTPQAQLKLMTLR